ncbi:hypothetical protein GW17_00028839 [Ensete ventricosum]|nr:hypothetical protein GW17_00028839 [Ensete ventricosum]
MTMNLKEGNRYVVNYDEDLMAVNFDGDVSLAEKEQTILLEASSIVRLDQTIMPPQDQAPMNDANLEPIPMNLKEGDRYVVNHGECLMIVDFGGYVRLAEKRSQDGKGGRQQHDCRWLRMAWMANGDCREERNRGSRQLEDYRGKQGSKAPKETLVGLRQRRKMRPGNKGLGSDSYGRGRKQGHGLGNYGCGKRLRVAAVAAGGSDGRSPTAVEG